MKKTLSLILVLTLIFANLPATARTFPDLGGHQWARAEIEYLASREIIQGDDAGNFNPARNITRADFVVLLARMQSLTNSTPTPSAFIDVPEYAYFSAEVALAVQAGWLNGFEDGTFRPFESITRQDMFVIIARMLSLETNAPNPTSPFNDAHLIAEYARASIQALYALNLVAGRDGGIAPLDNATRAETAVLIYRINHYLTHGEPPPPPTPAPTPTVPPQATSTLTSCPVNLCSAGRITRLPSNFTQYTFSIVTIPDNETVIKLTAPNGYTFKNTQAGTIGQFANGLQATILEGIPPVNPNQFPSLPTPENLQVIALGENGHTGLQIRNPSEGQWHFSLLSAARLTGTSGSTVGIGLLNPNQTWPSPSPMTICNLCSVRPPDAPSSWTSWGNLTSPNVTFMRGGPATRVPFVHERVEVPYGTPVTRPATIPVVLGSQLSRDPVTGVSYRVHTYTFLGWYEEGSSTPFDFSTPITRDIVLTGRWLQSRTRL